MGLEERWAWPHEIWGNMHAVHAQCSALSHDLNSLPAILPRRFNLADTYQGVEEADGTDYNVEAVEDGPRPFYCLLDTGLKRTSTGSKVFAALKASNMRTGPL